MLSLKKTEGDDMLAENMRVLVTYVLRAVPESVDYDAEAGTLTIRVKKSKISVADVETLEEKLRGHVPRDIAIDFDFVDG